MQALALVVGLFASLGLAQSPTHAYVVNGAGATISPSVLAFDATVTATSAPQTVTLGNDSGGAITVQSLPISPRFVIVAGGSCVAPPFTLANTQSCTLRIAFSSTSVGIGFAGTLTPTTTPSGVFVPTSVALSGNATPAAMSLSPATLTFNATVTATSAAQPVTLQNNSDVSVSVSTVTTTPRFTITPGGSCAATPFTLAPGQNCSVNLVFSSTSVGNGFSGTLTVTTNPTTTQTPTSLTLTGNATAAAMSLSPASLTFNATVTATSAAQPVTLQNNSDVSVSISTLTTTPRFAIAAGGSCAATPFTLAPSQSCSVNLVFSSTNVGNGFSGSLSVATNPTTTQTPTTVALTGNATPAAMSFSPASLTFNATVTATSAAQPVTLQNDSDVSVSVTTLTTTPRFAIAVGGNCGAPPFTLTTGQACTVNLAFSSTNVGNGFAGTLNATTTPTTTLTPAAVALTGNATPIQALLEPVMLDFGERFIGVASGPLFVGIGNLDANATLAITAFQLSSPRYAVVDGGSCPSALPFNIAPGNSCMLAIVFHPTSTATTTSTFQALSAPGLAEFSPVVISVTGTGIVEPSRFRGDFE